MLKKFVVCGSFILSCTTALAQATYYEMVPGTINLTCPPPIGVTYYVIDPDISIAPPGPGGDALCPPNSNSALNYQNSLDMITTVTNAQGYCFQLSFPLNAMGYCPNDTLWIHNGPSTASPLLTSLVWGANAGFCTNSNSNPAGAPATTTGTSVTFRVKSDGIDSRRGHNIQLSCVTCPSAPANNECAGAIQLSPSANCVYTSGTTFLATQSLPGCTGTANDDVWYRFTANNTTQTITVAPTTATMDPVIQLYSGSCSALTSLYCQNAGGVNVTETLTATGLSIGATYYIRVYDFGNNPNTNNYSFNICVVGASITDCAGSAQVCGTSSFSMTNSGVGQQEHNGATWGCLVSGEHSSAWYWFSFATGGTFEFNAASVGGVFQDADFAIWQPTNCTNKCGTINVAPTRCSYATAAANPHPALPPYSTGCSLYETAVQTTETAAGGGVVHAYVNALPVTAGQCYVLLLDIFSGSASYTMNWTLSGGASFQSCVLPIDLLYFNGENVGGINHLSWATATEHNNDYFTLERSADGEEFTEIARISGAGTSVAVTRYQWQDRFPLPGLNYYRLRQTDKDGAYQYTGVIQVYNPRALPLAPVIYPNPNDEGIYYVNLKTEDPTPVLLTVTDALGRLLEQRETTFWGSDVEQINVSDLPSGTYYLTLTDLYTGMRYTSRLVRF
ncbi:MAG: T9SS type A sorting domain-containing protein [Chitinophagales bacterium]|nr:T9SS type A sorting domain-containing protein [Chitinophagales bacterium]MDW8428243.1 T9SS type A sorting domain-containing protein [Chitinophagales bacterium]